MSEEEEIFAEALKLPVLERESFLQKACRNDKAIESRLKSLLAAHENPNGFLDLVETRANPEMEGLAEGHEIGPYHLLQKLGEGGFGVVYMAEQRQPIQRKVAIKIIKPGMDSQAVIARFEGERQALAMMDHPNIARVFDGGASDDGQRPYFVMELVQGVSITDYCDANSLSTRERLELFISVCNAVHHAHQKGIIHRDIKPSNVMVTLHDGKPVVKVIDFGVAKALHQRLTEKTLFTQYGMMVGTPQYMSPEQAEMTGLDVDTRSDIYSLSVLLYELMTGTTPLETDQLRTASLQNLRRMICEDEPLRPSLRLSTAGAKLTVLAEHRSVSPERLSREVQGDLDWIVLKGLEKDRNRRYETARDLAEDIHRTLNHQPVVAGPPSFAYRAKKFVRRNRIGITLAAAAAGVAVALLWGIFNHWQHRLSDVRKDEARLNDAVDDASAALLAAVESPNSTELWTSADLMVDRIAILVDKSASGESTFSRATTFLQRFEKASKDRELTFSMEELLVSHSTNQSIVGLQTMETEFRRILKKRGYDLDTLSPDDVTLRLKADHAPVKVTDALELWLSTRIKIADTSGEEMKAGEIEQWIGAMNVADPHSLRTAIRRTIFQTAKPEKATLDKAVDESDLSKVCARKLSWLAQAYQQVGDPKRSTEVRDYALALHSDNLLLNFEHANRLMKQNRTHEAIRYLMRCTSIRPGISGVWKRLAEALGQNNERQKALQAIKVAIELAPQDATSHLQLSRWLSRDHQPEAAIAAAEKALSLDGNLVETWRIIGHSKMELKKYPQALVAFEKFQSQSTEESEQRTVKEWIMECQKQIGSSQ